MTLSSLFDDPPAAPGAPDGQPAAPGRSLRDSLAGLPGLDSPDPDAPQKAANAATLAAELEAAGHVLLRYDARLFASNAPQLTVDQRTTIGTLKPYLLKYAQPWTPPDVLEGRRIDNNLIRVLRDTTPSALQNKLSDWTLQDPPSLHNATTVIVNFETNGLEWWKPDIHPVGMTIGTLDGLVHIYLPFGHKGGGPQHDPDQIKQYALDTLKHKHILNANTKFEVHTARQWGVDLEAQGNTVSDIQHWAALLDDTRRKFSLDYLAKDFLDGPQIPKLDERWMEDYRSDQVAPRAEYQVLLVSQLRNVLWPKIVADDLEKVLALENEVIYPVCEMEKNAAPLDREMLKEWCRDAQEMQEKLLYEVQQAIGFSVNPDAPSDMERLFQALNIPVEHYTEGGKKKERKPSFADSVLKAIKHPVIRKVRKAGQIASLRSKFLDAYDAVVGDDWLLRYQLHQLRNDEHGTIRGRFSASDVNIQQTMNVYTHKQAFETDDFFVRRLYIPANGYYFAIDADQIEFRIFASYSGSKSILDGYAADPTMSYHKKVGEIIQPFVPNLPYPKVKSYNFLKIYGGGKAKAAAYLEIPRVESDKLVAIYDRMFPEIPKTLRNAENLAKSRGYVKTILGRRARFPDDKFAYKALNAVIQGSAADIMKRKLVELHNERQRTGFTMRMTVHDEVCGDVPDEESARLVSEVLNRQSFPELKVPILWTGKTGRHWAECK